MKIVVIGGVAGGASAAARARRVDEDAEIIIFERGEYVSFANCGLPYHVGEIIEERESLLLMTPEKFLKQTGIKVKIKHEVVEINRKAKSVKVKNIEDGKVFEESYDKLILSPGSSPIRPPIEGADNPDVMVLWTINDMDKVNAAIDSGVKSAAVIGGGFIGIEVAENLRHRDIQTSLVEMLPQVMPQIDMEMTQPINDILEDNKIKLYLNNGVEKITSKGKGFSLKLKDATELDVDMVIMAIGVKPNIELAKSSELELGTTGAIKVNENLQTTDPDIYAVGDAIEVTNLVTGRPARIPLAGPANKQGRMATNNVFGAKEAYRGSLGTAICKIFDLAIANTGANEKTLKQEGIEYRKIYLNPFSHASYYPGASVMNMKVLFSPEGKIFGAQIVGQDGIDKRIDIIATAIINDINIIDLEKLELAYAPPFGSAKDPVNFVGYVANNMLKGDTKIIYPDSLPEEITIIDVRSPDEFACGAAPGAKNIPLPELRNRLDEIPKDKEIGVMCQSGIRSYNSEQILKQKGFKVSNIAGGYITWLLFHPKSNSVLKEETFWHSQENTGIGSSSETKISESANFAADADIELNACGLQCPGPIVAVKNKIEEMKDGEILKVTASDMGFRKDLPSWCRSTGNEMINIEHDSKNVTAFIRKQSGNLAAAGVNAMTSPVKKTTLVLFSNDFDKTMAAFILATGFASLGHEVSIFFTFWGLNVLRKNPGPKVKKDILSRMFGMMMPKGATKLVLSKMHMMGAGTAMMKYVMDSKKITSLPELIKQAREMKVKFIACEMAMNVMGIKIEELLYDVDTAGVANFAELSEKSGTTLFI